MNAPIRNILGQVKRKIDFGFMMDDHRLFIANLSKGKLGAENANRLGSLLTTQFQLAAMRRADRPECERQDFFLFIDEFHNFTTDSFAAILAEARKYRLSLTLSHQYTEQLAPEIRQAVLGNVGTIISFRVGAADAQVLEQELGGTFCAAEFVDLNRFHVIVKQTLESGSSWFRAKILPPVNNYHGRRGNLIRRSREKYASRRTVVEQKVERWLNRSQVA